MSTSAERRMAEQLYHSGQALFEQGLYNEALRELRRAEDSFRSLDSGGHAFSHFLANGISGLANSLALSGLCCQRLGDYKSAITCYETSLINAKFEKKKPFRAFLKKLRQDMSFCYEKLCEDISPVERDNLTNREPEIDISFRFPYSLPSDVIPFARLYELSPEQHKQYEHFHKRARRKDAEIRRQSQTIDDSAMKRMSIYVWTILFTIWSVYALIAIEAFLHSK